MPWLAAALLCGAAIAGAPDAPREPPREVQPPERIPKLVVQLGNDAWEAREQASKALREIGEPALAALRQAATSGDAETATRAALLVSKITRDMAFSRIGNTLIADTYAGRVIEIDREGREDWAVNDLDHPVDAQRLVNGHTLITDFSTSRVPQVSSDGNVVWEFASLHNPCAAVRLRGRKAAETPLK